MISQLPVIKLPNSITQICSLELKNTKHIHSDIAIIIENDKFLSLWFKKSFEEYSKQGGLSQLLSMFGWEGLRNRIAEAYLYYAKYGKYPLHHSIDEVKSVLHFERKFDFLFSETNSRVFLLGLYLKMCEIDLENQEQFDEQVYTEIPESVVEILKTGKSKTNTPDWLILTVWSFFTRYGKTKCLDIFKTSKGSINEIINQTSKIDYGMFIMDLLIYGHAISDISFFTEVKV